MSAQIECTEKDNVLTVGFSRRGRLMASLYRIALLFPLIMGGLAIFFMPDYIFELREAEPVPGLYIASLAGMALLVSVLSATLRYLRSDMWIFDGNARTVTAQIKTLWGKPGEGEVDMRDVEALAMKTRAWPRRSELHIYLDTGQQEVMFYGRGLADEIEEVAHNVIEFMREQRYHIELIEPDDEE